LAKENSIKLEGEVLDSLPNATFKVAVVNEDSKSNHIVLCHLCGKMRQNFIRVVSGDSVEIEISPYDLTKGRIVKRK
jgi:translation initiation factor IF-1